MALQSTVFSASKPLSAFLACLLLAACSPSEPEQPSQPSATPPPSEVSSAVVYEGARIIIGNGAGPIENGTFIVEDGRFVAVAASGAIQLPAGARRVDLSGATVMPMIIDTHVHLNNERAALENDLRLRAYYGTSAVLNLGMDEGEAPFALQQSVLPGLALYRTAGRGITSPEPGRSEIPYWVTTVEEARAAVQEEAATGVDIIKIWVDDRNGQYEQLGPDLYRAVIDEAHQLGLRVTAHILRLEDAKDLLRAGVDAFAHGVRDTDVDEEIIALFRERPGFVYTPNLPARGVPTDLSWLSDSISAEQLEALQANNVGNEQQQANFAIQARNLARLSSENLTFTLGTDGNTPWGAHIEMEDMVAAGMSPAQVLVAATSAGAEFLGLDTGSIEAGMSADFIVLNANPLDDITNTRTIRAVYLRGEEVNRN